MFMKPGVLLQWSLAVVVSLILWGVSIEDKPFEVNRRLPVSPPTVPSDYMVLGGFDEDSVEVSFIGRGTEVLIDQLFREPVSLRVSITPEEQAGSYPVSVSRRFSQGDIEFRDDPYAQLSSASFSPGSVTFTIDRTVVRNLPVSVRSASEIPERYFWSISSHETVEIRGAQSIVDRLDSLYTVPVEPRSTAVSAPIVKPEGVIYISPSSVTAELVPPAQVISQLR
ncbi:MAG: YbbR-like domain-containing protein [Candidatus Aegiribacteria sp.]